MNKRIPPDELAIADKEPVFQNEEKEKPAKELITSTIAGSTDTKSAGEKLQKSLKEISDYKYALDQSSIVAITDQKGIIQYVNNNFCRISKYSSEELIGQDHRIINSGYHPKEFIGDLWVTIANGKIWKGELKNKAKDGSIYWVDTTIVPFLNEKGKPYQYVAIRADITKRKSAEEKLQKSLKEISDYKHALDQSSIVAITDQKGIIKYVNNNFCRISKYSSEELIGQDHRIINSGYHPKEFIGDLWVTIANGKIWKGELKNKAKDGSIYWVDTTIVPFLNEKGKPYQYVAIRADITKRKSAEELIIANKELVFQNAEKEKRATELAIANKELAFQSEEKEKRAAELVIANKELAFQNEEKEKRAGELIIANKELVFQNAEKEKRATELAIANKELAFQSEEKENRAAELDIANKELVFQNEEKEKRAAELIVANNELESFSYSVAHDLRAPLRAISGNAKILEEDYAGKFDADGNRSLHSLAYNSNKMGKLIDYLLAFSRLGRKEVTVSEINMNELVKSAVEELLSKDNENRPEFNVQVLPPAKGDQALIKQVWINLISNAIKYSKNKPKPNIEIGAYEKDKLVVYYIKDNGVGFDMEYYDKLFGVFQRLHSQEEFEGTGIGLAIVQKIVQRHKGKVWAESKLSEGACFYFSLPGLLTGY